MKIAITGGTGLIGSRLIPYLQHQGHDIVNISRSAPREHHLARTITWEQLGSEPSQLEGVTAIINLAGESINQRWTEAAKKRIVESRLMAADRITGLMERLKVKPSVVVNASGMSIYGTSETETYDERSPHRLVDFLSAVVEQWEQAADRIPAERLVKVRVGIVLDRKGGAFPKMALPYKLGVGGKIGSGKQWLSWIHIEDMVRLIDFCMQNERISGPVNATAPNPVTNEHFGRVLAETMHRPNLFPVPGGVMKLLFGELSTLLLEGQKVLPHVLLEHGFQYKFPTIREALTELTRSTPS